MATPFGSLAAKISAEIDFEFEKAVIAAVKSFRCLYDRHYSNYNSIKPNESAWNNIAKLLKRSAIECMDKWFSLVHIFFHHQNVRKLNPSAELTNWPHFESLLEIDGLMATKYMQLIQYKPTYTFCVPVENQRDQLVTELIYHRSDLLNPKTSIEQAHNIWARITQKLNTHGVALPIIRWQKYWWDMKLEFARRLSYMQKSVLICKSKNFSQLFKEDEIRILEFCGVKTTDSISSISAVMWSNIEFGNDLTKIIRTCKKCTTILSDIVKSDYCERCSKEARTFCDLCSKNHKEPSKVYQTKNWSEKAKNTLPDGFQSFAELSMCMECLNSVKRNASKEWMVCRVCERQQLLDYLFRDANDQLRNAFKEATNVEFSEFDGLPAYICKMCKVQMQQFNNFYLRFNRTKTRLQNFHDTQFIQADSPVNGQKSRYNLTSQVVAKPQTSMPSPTPPVKVIPPSISSKTTDGTKTFLLNPKLPLKVTATPPISTIIRDQARGTPKFVKGRVIKRAIYSTAQAPISKRVCIAPTNTQVVTHSGQPLTSGPYSQIPPPRNISILPTGHTPVPLFTKHTGVTIAKRICTTQPAVFKINQSTQSPTMYCISKAETSVQSVIGTENPISNGQMVPNNPPQSTAITHPTIKIEKDDFPTAVSKISMQPSRAALKIAENQKNIKTMPLDIPTVVEGQNSVDFSTTPAILPYTFQNEFLTTNVFASRKIKLMHELQTKRSLKKSNDQPQPPQQQKKLPTLPTNPRMRKYWGPVDEFQITSVAEKTQHLNPNQTSSDAPNSGQHSSTTAPSGVCPPVLEIKIEDDQTEQSMFYPDSFELNKVSLDVDVSFMLNTMIKKDIPPDIARNTDNSPVDNISKEDNESKKNADDKKKNDNALGSNKREKTDDAPQPPEVPAEVKQPNQIIPKSGKPETAPVKKVQVKIKRSDRLKNLESSDKPSIATRLRRRKGLSRTAKQNNVKK